MCRRRLGLWIYMYKMHGGGCGGWRVAGVGMGWGVSRSIRTLSEGLIGAFSCFYY